MSSNPWLLSSVPTNQRHSMTYLREAGPPRMQSTPNSLISICDIPSTGACAVNFIGCRAGTSDVLRASRWDTAMRSDRDVR